MSIIKCKMCGGDLEIQEGLTVAVCEYCGSKQTLPSVDNDKKLNLFQRANRLRFGCEFDKAAGVYEAIVADFPEEAEAYWGLVLCKYGIEYVDDSATAKKIPTCHRSSFDSVMDDANFELVMEYSDSVARSVYREEAKAIEELRKGIIEVSGKEEPYDIFICYKEMDETGERTIDSVLAQDVYDALCEKGYRVFFSRITLEDKLGQEYEPYIFAALNSAKVMLAFGTSYDYYNAVWVKNEWSRFLQLMTADKSKHLIPCYKDIDAYDMPKEFAKLQSQDVGKVGAVQDLLRGVEKLLGAKKEEQPKETVIREVVSTGGVNVDSLIKRGYMALEDKKWDAANDFFNRALDINAECAEAYLGCLMADLKVTAKQNLSKLTITFSNFKNYKKAYRFGDEGLKKFLEETIDSIKQGRYAEASELMLLNEKIKYEQAAALFGSIIDYKDSNELYKKCIKKAEEKRQKNLQEMKEVQKKLKKTRSLQANIKNEIISINQETENIENERINTLKGQISELHTEYSKLKLFDLKHKMEISQMILSLNSEVEQKIYEIKNEKISSIWNKASNRKVISAGGSHTVGLKSDGTVVAVGDNQYGQCDISDWTDIVEVSAGTAHTVGLRSDGTVIAVGDNQYGQCNVSYLTDIVSISAGELHTVGLKSNGTVVAIGNNKDEQCNVANWKDIVAISAGVDYTAGLTSFGEILFSGPSSFSGRLKYYNCQNGPICSDVVAISASTTYGIVFLKTDGNVNVTHYQNRLMDGWENIISISASDGGVIGLKHNGTVFVTAGLYYRQCDVSDWTDIVEVSAGTAHTVGLKKDGTVVATGDNKSGQCDISDWTDIKLPEKGV